MVLNAPHNDFLKTANQKFLDGDGIDDLELGALLKFYKEMEAGLRFLGPGFRIIWKEVLRRLNDLEDFKRARKAG